MAIELWANNANSTLASSITNADLTLTVQSGHGARFPAPGSDYFYVTLDDGANVEIVKCTARSTDTLTIVRAQQSTSAVSFSSGTAVELRLTKASLEGLQGGAPEAAEYWVETSNSTLSAEVVVGTTGITTAAYASRQAAAKAGRLFLPSDGFQIERDTGSAWAPWGPLYPFTAPVDADFSWVNQGSATVSTTNGGIHVSCVSNGSTQNARLRAKTLPSAPYTLTVALLPLMHYSNYSIILFGLRKSSDDTMVLFQIENDGSAIGFQYVKWTNVTTPAGGPYIGITNATPMPNPLVFLRIQDNNTNRILSWSADGQNFMQLHSIGRTDHTTPNQAVFGVNPYSQVTGVTLLSWKETA